MKRFVQVSLLVLCCVATGGCRTAALVDPAPIQYESTGSKKTRNAIVRAMANRGWTVQSESSGEIVARNLVRGKHEVVVRITYSRDEVDIAYVSSRNMKYDGSAQTIHKNYNNWVQFLAEDIRRELTILSTR
ncbi:MAG: hypothetical protein CMJ18_26695 [Phycisphaeraceae bacterium]|nr:hypothetical protein [Phycisphaeraceae bacterium]